MSHFQSIRPIAQRRVDSHSLIAICGALLLIGLAISLGGAAASFFDIKSLLIVLGGTVGATLIVFTVGDLQQTSRAVKEVFLLREFQTERRIHRLLELLRQARLEGTLSLESALYSESDPFLRKGLELLIDDIDEDEIRRLLSLEINNHGTEFVKGSQVFQTMGALSPSMGLIGTLIGLVHMLENLDNASGIGPAMAIALLTTFYGALIANLICLPLAAKLTRRAQQERLILDLTLEGLLSIKQLANPLMLEQKLRSFIPKGENTASLAA